MKKIHALALVLFFAMSAALPAGAAFAHAENSSPLSIPFFGFFSALLPLSDDTQVNTLSFRSFISDDFLKDVEDRVADIVAEATRPLLFFGTSTIRIGEEANVSVQNALQSALVIRNNDDDGEEADDDDFRDRIAFSVTATSSEPCVIPLSPFDDGTPPFIRKDGKVKIISSGNTFIFKDGKHKIISTPSSYIEKNGKEKLIVTPGVRIYKNGSVKEIIRCNGVATTTPPTPDTMPPIIASLSASTTSTTSAKIAWTTDEKATAVLHLSTSTPLSLPSAQSHTRSTLKTSHSFVLSGLSASTTYYYVVSSTDRSGNTATSSERSFTTPEMVSVDATPPVITALSLTTVGSTTATVAWTTNESATSKAYFGTSTPLLLGAATTVGTTTLSTHHSITLEGLATSTAHYLVVESKDAAGNTARGSEISFTTAAN